ncbi:GUN4 domain-containing protein [Microcoleus sp. CAWBG640]|uniref:GUN4 domain-containing protein n=1 Tax=Microcoleus sp. CAWBG640 TaxID=2841653 RepID=UPI00312B483F
MSNTGGDEIDLVSSMGVDYTKLRNLLAAGEWKKADEETARVMLKVADREEEGYLGRDDFEDFYCKDLRTIDQLWVKYSNGRFGFSVQNCIYQSLSKDKGNCDRTEKFFYLVGWCNNDTKELLNYNDLQFKTRAPEGFLPVAMRFGLEYRWGGSRGAVGVGWWGDESRDVFLIMSFSDLFNRLIKCNI